MTFPSDYPSTSTSSTANDRSPRDNQPATVIDVYEKDSPPNSARKWRRRCLLAVTLWLASSLLMSFPVFRGLVAYPLHVHDKEASGEAAYVMADGPATFERLRAASDLFHWDRVSRVILLNETDSSGYNFMEHRPATRVERFTDYLVLFGVPRDKISTVDAHKSTSLGSLSEARAVAEQEPDLQSIVVVTSAPHTRRSGLAFRRSMGGNIPIAVYSASDPFHSDEIHSPIWVEYAKLLVYWIVA